VKRLGWAILFVLFTAAPSHGEPTTLTESYATSNGAVTTSTFDCDQSALNVSGVCFRIPAGSVRVSVTIADAHTMSVGGSYSLFTEFGNRLTSGAMCGRFSTAVNPNAAILVLYLGPFPTTPLLCTPGVGTTGTVTVVFT
jgi:hypothetical protein